MEDEFQYIKEVVINLVERIEALEKENGELRFLFILFTAVAAMTVAFYILAAI